MEWMLEQRHLKALRGATTAILATFVALMSHIAGGATVPGPLGIVIPLVLALPICIAISGQKLSLLTLSASVIVSQVFFHALFIFGSAGWAVHTGHAHHANPASAAVSQMPPLEGSAHTHLLLEASPAMMVAHALAAVITIAALYRGEIALRLLVHIGRRMVGLRRALLVLVPATEKPAPASIPAAVQVPRVSLARQLLPVHAYRGPPNAFV